jgi:opacity protein-like surface antigen
MKKLITVLFLSISISGFSQYLGLELFVGGANYNGDLMEKTYTLKGGKMAFGAGLSYTLTKQLTVRAMLMYGKLGADDKNNTDITLINRNLNFKSSVFEFGIQGVYHILNTEMHRVNPYLMAGISVFHTNPYTYDTLGNKFYLKPLSTEGQGLNQYPDRQEYSLTQISFPFGAGIKFTVTKSVSIAWEIGLRKTFTDYIDDLSTTYVDNGVLLAAKGPKAVELAYRGGEVKTGNPVYPRDGTIRGSAKADDWYYFSGITATFILNNSEAAIRRRSSIEQVACPRSIF